MPPTHDPATPHDTPGHREGPAPVAQWVGLLLAPAVFAVHLQVGYLLVLWGCGRETGALWIHVAGALSVLLAAVGVWAAWLTWVKSGRVSPGEGPGPVPRTRLMATTGLGMSALLTVLLLAQWITAFFLSPCH
ncbi:MAG TPA: hypothetical protein VEA99_07730 [Gemmatimonadaceae bacterium]|nr:hypothetical protein [Gemmatimonadaceae bacterium]